MPRSQEGILTRKIIYVASPLFNDAEKAFNLRVRDALLAGFDVYLPQADGLLLVDIVKDGMDVELGSRMVFEEDERAIRQCDILLIVLDGRTVDEGAAFELGLAFGLGKDCYGLQTDVRRLLPYGNNPMIRHPLKEVFGGLADLEAFAKKVGSPNTPGSVEPTRGSGQRARRLNA